MVNSQHTFSTRRLAGSDMQHLSRHPHWSLDFEPLVLCTFDQISTDCDSQRKTRNMLGFSLSMIMQKTCSDQEKKVGHVPNRLQWWVSSQCQHVDDYFDHSRYILKPHSTNTTMFLNKNGADLSQDSSHSWRKEWCECGELSQLPLQLPLSQVLKASPFWTQSSAQIHMKGTKNPRHFRKATANDCT